MTEHPDDLADLALGHVGGERRAALAEHLLACPTCRQEHGALVASIEEVVVTAPSVQPPLGFDQRTLARIGVGATSAPASGGRRRWPALAAAAALVVVLAVGGATLTLAGDDGPSDDRVAALVTDEGRDVGTATVTEVDGEPVLVVGLAVGAEGATYTCRMRFADGSTLDTAPWAAAPGAGWLVPLPTDRGPLTAIELTAPDAGSPWSTADLDT